MSSKNVIDAELDEYYLEESERQLEEDVRWFWQRTRQGPHDDCDCYWFYVQDLKQAIKRLRTFRGTTPKGVNDGCLKDVEHQLEEDVRQCWRATRNPHRLSEEVGGGLCPCSEVDIQDLKYAIKRLRLFRQGVYCA